MIADFLNFLANGVFDFLTGLLSLFPHMPFTETTFEDFIQGDLVLTVLGWVNYLIPVRECATIVSLWAAGMMVYVSLKIAKNYATSIVG